MVPRMLLCIWFAVDTGVLALTLLKRRCALLAVVVCLSCPWPKIVAFFPFFRIPGFGSLEQKGKGRDNTGGPGIMATEVL